MKIVVWIGSEDNQKALANKLHQNIGISALVVEKPKTSLSFDVSQMIAGIAEVLFIPGIYSAGMGMQRYYASNFRGLPDVPLLMVENINSSEVADFTRQHQAELVVVSGTRMIEEPNLFLPLPVGMIQLHNGLAPYVKGRVNCTNLCLAKKYYHLIGNSVIWTDNGIHSGNLLASEHTLFVGNESLKDIHIKVMEHSHDLCVRAVRYLTRGEKRSRPQSEFGEGNTYDSSDWSFSQKRKLISGMASFPFEINSKETTRKREQVQVYSLRN